MNESTCVKPLTMLMILVDISIIILYYMHGWRCTERKLRNRKLRMRQNREK
ncbi:hypothetical protein MHBO_003673 [Bonamia ostreae]|uniref:ATP synthase F0 subunit 8 n=1 Tax=Bonamia ostreae TaxID=126728 RepID=A0ABV2AR52_9EUKA